MEKCAHNEGVPATGPAAFATTHWSVVLAAGQAGLPQGSAALDKLCRAFALAHTGNSRPASIATIKLGNRMTKKSEGRNPKSKRNPKPEARKEWHGLSFGFRFSGFGFLSDFGCFFT